MHGLAGRDQLRGDRLDRVGGDREADAFVAAGVALDLGVDADDLALRVSSGPPELPWLIAASVWIESLMVNFVLPSIARWSALTMPPVTVSSSPKGLPIATTPSPTDAASSRRPRAGRAPRRERRPRPGRSTCPRRRPGGVGLAVPEANLDRGGAVDHMIVRDDVAVGVVDPARALCLGRCRRRRPVGCSLDGLGDRDLDDTAVGAGGRESVDRQGGY